MRSAGLFTVSLLTLLLVLLAPRTHATDDYTSDEITLPETSHRLERLYSQSTSSSSSSSSSPSAGPQHSTTSSYLTNPNSPLITNTTLHTGGWKGAVLTPASPDGLSLLVLADGTSGPTAWWRRANTQSAHWTLQWTLPLCSLWIPDHGGVQYALAVSSTRIVAACPGEHQSYGGSVVLLIDAVHRRVLHTFQRDIGGATDRYRQLAVHGPYVVAWVNQDSNVSTGRTFLLLLDVEDLSLVASLEVTPDQQVDYALMAVAPVRRLAYLLRSSSFIQFAFDGEGINATASNDAGYMGSIATGADKVYTDVDFTKPTVAEFDAHTLAEQNKRPIDANVSYNSISALGWANGSNVLFANACPDFGGRGYLVAKDADSWETLGRQLLCYDTVRCGWQPARRISGLPNNAAVTIAQMENTYALVTMSGADGALQSLVNASTPQVVIGAQYHPDVGVVGITEESYKEAAPSLVYFTPGESGSDVPVLNELVLSYPRDGTAVVRGMQTFVSDNGAHVWALYALDQFMVAVLDPTQTPWKILRTEVVGYVTIGDARWSSAPTARLQIQNSSDDESWIFVASATDPMSMQAVYCAVSATYLCSVKGELKFVQGTSPGNGMAVSHDGSSVYTCTSSAPLIVYDVSFDGSDKEHPTLTIRDHLEIDRKDAACIDVSVDPSGDYVLVLSPSTLFVIEAASWTLYKTIPLDGSSSASKALVSSSAGQVVFDDVTKYAYVLSAQQGITRVRLQDWGVDGSVAKLDTRTWPYGGPGSYSSLAANRGEGSLYVFSAGDIPMLLRLGLTGCASGTYVDSQTLTCNDCPAGKFTLAPGESECVSCPPGRHHTSDSHANGTCDFCPSGSYDSGSTSGCLDCPAGYHCPFGSAMPVPNSLSSTTVEYTSPSIGLPNGESTKTQSTERSLLIAAAVTLSAVGLILYLAYKLLPVTWDLRLRPLLIKLDIFSTDHYVAAGEPVMNSPQVSGGVAAVLFIISCAFLLLTLGLQYTHQSLIVQRSQLPLTGGVDKHVLAPVLTVKPYFSGPELYESGGMGGCHPDLDVAMGGIQGTSKLEVVCLQGTPDVVQIRCSSCYASSAASYFTVTLPSLPFNNSMGGVSYQATLAAVDLHVEVRSPFSGQVSTAHSTLAITGAKDDEVGSSASQSITYSPVEKVDKTESGKLEHGFQLVAGGTGAIQVRQTDSSPFGNRPVTIRVSLSVTNTRESVTISKPQSLSQFVAVLISTASGLLTVSKILLSKAEKLTQSPKIRQLVFREESPGATPLKQGVVKGEATDGYQALGGEDE